MEERKKRGTAKRVFRFGGPVFIVTVLIIGFQIFTGGMYLAGVPDADEVRRGTIAYPEKTDKVKEITDGEQIDLAVKLTGFLRYSLFERADEGGEPLVTVTYYLDDGGSITASANRETVWWKGKAHALKDRELFFNITEGLFFHE